MAEAPRRTPTDRAAPPGPRAPGDDPGGPGGSGPVRADGTEGPVADARGRASRRFPRAPRTPGGAAALVGAGAALVLLVGIDGPSLWTDEAATISASTRSLPELARMSGSIDAVHTLYYLLMHLWTGVLGTSELALRGASALATGLAAAGVHVLGSRFGGRRLALAASVTFVLLPRVAWMAVEARPYAFVTATAVWATVVLGTALERRRWSWWAGYGALVCVGVLLNIYVVLVVAAHGVTVLLLRGRGLRPFVVSAVCGLLPTVPLVLTARAQAAQIGENSVGLLALARNVVVNQFFLGETPTVFSRTAQLATPSSGPAGDLWRPASVLLAVVATALVVVAASRVVRAGLPWPEPARALAVWAGPWLVVPTVVLALYAVVAQTYSPRYLAFSTPAVALLLAAAVLAVRPRALRVAVVSVLVLCAVPVLVSQRTEHAKSGSDWRETAAAVEAGCAAGDAVYFAPRAAPQGELVRLTTRGVRVAYPEAFEGLRDLTLVTSAVEAGDLLGVSRRLEDALPAQAGPGRLCVVRRHDYPEAAREADDALLDSLGYTVTGTWTGPLDEVVVRSGREGDFGQFTPFGPRHANRDLLDSGEASSAMTAADAGLSRHRPRSPA